MKMRLALLLAIAALSVGGAAPAAFADNYHVAQDETTNEDDDGSDYGWIGLRGLAGLAGLLGRKRQPDYPERDRDRTTGSSTTR